MMIETGETSTTMDFGKIIDQVFLKEGELPNKKVGLTLSGGGSYYGDMVERKGDWVVLRTDSSYDRSVFQGVNKDRKIMTYIHLSLRHVVSLSIDEYVE